MVKSAQGTQMAKELGDRLKRERMRQGVSQKELAKQAGCAAQTLLDIEYGNVENSRFLPKIANALGASMHWLQTGEGKPNRPESAAVPVGMVPWSYYTELVSSDVDPQITDWVDGCPVPHSKESYCLLADETAAFAMAGVVNQGDWLFVDNERQEDGLVVCMMAGWNRAELRELTSLGGRQMLRTTNPALPQQLVPIQACYRRSDYVAALQVPGQDALPCLVLSRVIFKGAPW